MCCCYTWKIQHFQWHIPITNDLVAVTNIKSNARKSIHLFEVLYSNVIYISVLSIAIIALLSHSLFICHHYHHMRQSTVGYDQRGINCGCGCDSSSSFSSPFSSITNPLWRLFVAFLIALIDALHSDSFDAIAVIAIVPLCWWKEKRHRDDKWLVVMVVMVVMVVIMTAEEKGSVVFWVFTRFFLRCKKNHYHILVTSIIDNRYCVPIRDSYCFSYNLRSASPSLLLKNGHSECKWFITITIIIRSEWYQWRLITTKIATEYIHIFRDEMKYNISRIAIGIGEFIKCIYLVKWTHRWLMANGIGIRNFIDFADTNAEFFLFFFIRPFFWSHCDVVDTHHSPAPDVSGGGGGGGSGTIANGKYNTKIAEVKRSGIGNGNRKHVAFL